MYNFMYSGYCFSRSQKHCFLQVLSIVVCNMNTCVHCAKTSQDNNWDVATLANSACFLSQLPQYNELTGHGLYHIPVPP